MHQRLIASLVSVVVLAAAQPASAIPTAFGSGFSGGLTITNDTGAVLPALIVKSWMNPRQDQPGNFLTGVPLSLPGATLDTGDQPFAITYLNFPIGSHVVGNVIGSLPDPRNPGSSLASRDFAPSPRRSISGSPARSERS